jgi:Tol biopolymer transport system component
MMLPALCLTFVEESGTLDAPPQAAPVFYQEVTWSPDGARLSFTRMQGEGKEMKASVHVMRADGSQETKITDEATWATYSAWSPDGRKIAYGARTGEGRSDIFVVNADGSNPVRLTK